MKKGGNDIASLLSAYNQKSITKIRELCFSGIGDRDVYNITSPFYVRGQLHILGRVQERSQEGGSMVVFFRHTKKSVCEIVNNTLPIYDLEDPFVICLKELIIIGGVEVSHRQIKKGLSYRTVFYRGKDLLSLERFAHGPWGMKDIRFIQLPNKKFGVFTRPQGRKGGRGKIGFTLLRSLDDFKPGILSRAHLFDGQFAKGEWGGVNEVHLLKNGLLGVLGHVARYTAGNVREYYPISFCFDYHKKKLFGMKILVGREDLPRSEAKRFDLYSVVYPGGIIRIKHNKAKLYIGVGDAAAYEITIHDPFLAYERL